MNYSPDYFIHVANVLLLVAYSVRDILWLRLFAVAASVVSIPYFLLQPATLWAGSALILSGLQTDVEAVVESPVRAMRWQIGTLERYLNANPDTRAAMQRHLAHDLATKVEHLASD